MYFFIVWQLVLLAWVSCEMEGTCVEWLGKSGRIQSQRAATGNHLVTRVVSDHGAHGSVARLFQLNPNKPWKTWGKPTTLGLSPLPDMKHDLRNV